MSLSARDGESRPLEMGAGFEVGRPPGLMPGSPLDFPLVIQFGPLPFPPGQRYEWILEIDGHCDPHWRLAFSTGPVEVGA